MKTRIKVKNGVYYPQHRFLGFWLTFTAYQNGYDSVVSFSDLNHAKIFIDRRIANKVSETCYIEYPKPLKLHTDEEIRDDLNLMYSPSKALFVEPTDVYECVKSVIQRILGSDYEVVCLSAKIIDDLGADSLDVVELHLGIEDEFNLSIPEKDIAGIVTVEDIVVYVSNRL